MSPLTIRVDIDTQHGFCDPAGGLYVQGADAVVARVARLNQDALRRGLPLIGSVDSHDFASPEFRANGGPWPVHCVKGTWDWLKPPATLPARFRLIGRDRSDVAAAFDDGRTALYFEKAEYSVFDNVNLPPLLDLLTARAGGAPLRFEVYGVATDYCVKAAALELRRRGHEVVLVEDAIAGVAPATTSAARAEMQAAGVGAARSEDLLPEPAGARA